MLVQKEKLIQLVNHDDGRVRNACSKALERFFPNSEGVVTPLLTAIQAHTGSESALTQAAMLRFFIPTGDDVKEILDLHNRLYKIKPKELPIMSTVMHLHESLLNAPFHILEIHADSLSSDPTFQKAFKRAKKLNQLCQSEPQTLRAQLESLSEQYAQEQVEDEDPMLPYLIETALFQKADQETKEQISRYLGRSNDEINIYLQESFIRLSGYLKIEASIPHLFRFLRESEPLDNAINDSITALGRIGTREVVQMGEAHYRTHKEFGTNLLEILKYIPQDYAEESAVKFLTQSEDPQLRTVAAGALCDIFSDKYKEKVLEVVRRRDYDNTIMELTEYLVPVYVYHGASIDQQEELEKSDREFREQALQSSPFYNNAKKIKQALESYAADYEQMHGDDFDDDFDDDDIDDGDLDDDSDVPVPSTRKSGDNPSPIKLPSSKIPSKKKKKKKKK